MPAARGQLSKECLSMTSVRKKNFQRNFSHAALIRRFADERAFDLAFLPSMAREEANRFNILDQPYFFDGAVALLGPERDQFLRDYKFDIAPTTDDRPYFFDFFKLSSAPGSTRTSTANSSLENYSPPK
jgi:hypothetical protein